MKKLLASFLATSTLLFAVGFAQPAMAADEPGAKSEAIVVAQAAAPAAEPAAPAAAPTAAATPAALAAAADAAAPAPVPNKGDTAWMMIATVLVILMTIPGLALFYGGLVRTKNMLSILMQVFVIFSLVVVLWCI